MNTWQRGFMWFGIVIGAIIIVAGLIAFGRATVSTQQAPAPVVIAPPAVVQPAPARIPASRQPRRAPSVEFVAKIPQVKPAGCHDINVGGKVVHVTNLEGQACFTHTKMIPNRQCPSGEATAEPSGMPPPYEYHFNCLPS